MAPVPRRAKWAGNIRCTNGQVKRQLQDRVTVGSEDTGHQTTEKTYTKFTPDYVVGATAALEGLGTGKSTHSQRMKLSPPL